MKILDVAKNMTFEQNVVLRVLDADTYGVVQEHRGHNCATNSMLEGIAHYLTGDGVFNQGYSMLANYVPQYISLGTMGLISQEQDSQGLPAGIGESLSYQDDPSYNALLNAMNAAKTALDSAQAAYNAANCGCNCSECTAKKAAATTALNNAKRTYNQARNAVLDASGQYRYIEYMNHAPGYGADGYDEHKNNNRKYFGLGWPYTCFSQLDPYSKGTQRTYNGTVYQVSSNVDPGPWDSSKWVAKEQLMGMELIDPTFPRSMIDFREIIPETKSELPNTVDVVFSAMISTGALKRFRTYYGGGTDPGYIFITEAGLWSRKSWVDGGDNGLLAGYRIMPRNESQRNYESLKKEILRVGVNQVVQVIWKIQLGSLSDVAQINWNRNVTCITTGAKYSSLMVASANTGINWEDILLSIQAGPNGKPINNLRFAWTDTI